MNFRDTQYKVYKYERLEGLVAFFEVEVRIVIRYIPRIGYNEVEIERADHLPMCEVTDPKENRNIRILMRN